MTELTLTEEEYAMKDGPCALHPELTKNITELVKLVSAQERSTEIASEQITLIFARLELIKELVDKNAVRAEIRDDKIRELVAFNEETRRKWQDVDFSMKEAHAEVRVMIDENIAGITARLEELKKCLEARVNKLHRLEARHLKGWDWFKRLATDSIYSFLHNSLWVVFALALWWVIWVISKWKMFEEIPKKLLGL